MARVKIRKEIEIERNVVEKILMKVKDYIKENRQFVLYSLSGLLAAAVLLISGLVYHEYSTEKDLVKYEQIMDNYRALSGNNNKTEIKKVIKDLKSLLGSTWFGHVNSMGYYTLGNIYFSEKMYSESIESLTVFADKSSSSIFAALALQKIAVAAEESGKKDFALKTYKKLEEDYSDSAITDQVFYNLGRIYQVNGDLVMAEKYYTRLISSYPQSPCTRKAKVKLFLMKRNK